MQYNAFVSFVWFIIDVTQELSVLVQDKQKQPMLEDNLSHLAANWLF